MKYFRDVRELQRYIEVTVIQHLQDTLDRMSQEEYPHYTDRDRQVMRRKLQDVKAYFDKSRLFGWGQASDEKWTEEEA